jgi:hypothetical protein
VTDAGAFIAIEVEHYGGVLIALAVQVAGLRGGRDDGGAKGSRPRTLNSEVVAVGDMVGSAAAVEPVDQVVALAVNIRDVFMP